MKAIITKHHFMVDLETLSSQSNAHILETALVCFHPVSGVVYESKSFHVRHGLDSQGDSHTNTQSLDWWYKNNRDYFAKLLDPSEKQQLVDTLCRMYGTQARLMLTS